MVLSFGIKKKGMMIIKIGILTFHDADNYGAVLQAYALKETIKKIEEDVEILNYKRQVSSRNIILLIKSILSTLMYLYPPRSIRKIKFTKFRNKYMDISKDTFFNSAEIKGKDIYVVGSDQVWNSEITNYDEAYFLKFCRGHEKKIAYAASIGKDILKHEEKKFLKNNVSNIDYISVREDSAVKIIRDFIEKKVTHVLDPTLLADRDIWDRLICENKNRSNYLLVYRLTDNEEVLRVAELIAKKLKLKVLYIDNLALSKNCLIRKRRYKFRDIKGVGPIDFITLFKNASFVVTNSFHGTAFSIVFNKDFITIPHETRGTRMISLLKLLKLDHRLITNSKQLTDDYPLNIDYQIPNKLLEREREKSIAFLKNAIES
ncbi:MAG: polysaccharide pyruvyl transferase family protein [Acidaminococcaceae bacterium]|nr:polysaccharide pyruvyl transferase family protein [Acidaminococcaceae bacterium]